MKVHFVWVLSIIAFIQRMRIGLPYSWCRARWERWLRHQRKLSVLPLRKSWAFWAIFFFFDLVGWYGRAVKEGMLPVSSGDNASVSVPRQAYARSKSKISAEYNIFRNLKMLNHTLADSCFSQAKSSKISAVVVLGTWLSLPAFLYRVCESQWIKFLKAFIIICKSLRMEHIEKIKTE